MLQFRTALDEEREVSIHVAAHEREEGRGPPVRVAALPRVHRRFGSVAPGLNTRRIIGLAVMASICVGIVIGSLAWGGVPSVRRPAVLGSALVAAAGLLLAWKAPGRRLAWALLAAGAFLWSVGRQYRPSWRGVAAGAPVGLEALILPAAMVCFSIAVMLLLSYPHRAPARLRALAEALMIGSSVVFASWVMMMPAAFEAVAQRSSQERVLLLASPVANMITLTVAIFALTRPPNIGARLSSLVAVIAMLPIVSSVVNHTDPAQADRLDTVDLAAFLLFLVILLVISKSWPQTLQIKGPDRTEPQVELRRAQLLLLSVPGLSVLVVVGTTVRQLIGQPVAVELTWITIGVLTLSVLLHVTVVYENHSLSAELASARDEALHASAMKSQFLANVSHEIRTPMNAVIGLTGLLLDTELDSDQQELAIGVATSAEGLLGLIDAVLDFSKIEAEKVELEEIELDLEDLLDEVAMILGDAARRKGIELIAYCEPGLNTRRRGDPVRLRQILLNLATNAVKFTAKGSVTLQASPVPDAPDAVAFLVVDTGTGIPQAEQDRIFEPFSQLDESTTRKFGGTGLGLGIVTGLVDLQGGTIDLESEVGVGTAFRVTLPLPRGEQKRVEKGLSALFGLRALVVDENAVNRSVLAYTLHGWGFEVDQAASAEDALHHYGWSPDPSKAYALALVDHRMDGMNGLELARAMRCQAPTARAHILLLTSVLELSRQEAHDAGIQSVLIKPVRNTYLLRRIVDLIITKPPAEPSVDTYQEEVRNLAPNPAR